MNIGAFFAALLIVGQGDPTPQRIAAAPPAIERSGPIQLAAVPPGTEPPTGLAVTPPTTPPKAAAKQPGAKKGSAATAKPRATAHRKTPPKSQAKTPVVTKPNGVSRACPSGMTKQPATGRCVQRAATASRRA